MPRLVPSTDMRHPCTRVLGLLVLLTGFAPGQSVLAAPDGVAVFVSPERPEAGGPLRAVAVSFLT